MPSQLVIAIFTFDGALTRWVPGTVNHPATPVARCTPSSASAYRSASASSIARSAEPNQVDSCAADRKRTTMAYAAGPPGSGRSIVTPSKPGLRSAAAASRCTTASKASSLPGRTRRVNRTVTGSLAPCRPSAGSAAPSAAAGTGPRSMVISRTSSPDGCRRSDRARR